MRFLLLSFDWIRVKDPQISLASASILTYLKHMSPQFQFSHRRFDVSNGQIESVTQQALHQINEIRPQVIGIGIYVWNETFVSHLFQQMAKSQTTHKPVVVLGGPQITYSYKGSLERLYPYGNAFIRGHAEHSLAKLLIAINRSQKPNIKGVHYSGDADVGEKSELILGNIPSPLVSGQTGLHSGDSDNKRDNTDFDRIEKEVEWIVGQRIDDISIVDPVFNTKSSNYLKVLDLFLKYGYKGRLNLQTRLEMIEDKYMDTCSRLMANNVNVELECGVQTLIPKEMKIIERPQSLVRMERMADKINDRGIAFEVSLIYGLPEQSVHSFRQTVSLVEEKLRPNRVRAWPLMLLKGTKMFDMKQRFRLREKLLDSSLKPLDDMRQYNGIPHVVSSNTFTEEEWNAMKDIADELNKKNNF